MTESPERPGDAPASADPEQEFEPEFDVEPDPAIPSVAPFGAAPLLLPTETGTGAAGADRRAGADDVPPPGNEYRKWGRVAGAVAVQAELIRATRAPRSGDDLVALAVNNAWFDPVAGTLPGNIGRILEAHGIGCRHVPDARFDDVQTALLHGDSPVVAIAAPGGTGAARDGGRCVRVVGVDDGPGGAVHVVIDDPLGATARSEAVDLSRFLADWDEFARVLVVARTGRRPVAIAVDAVARPRPPGPSRGKGLADLLHDAHRDPSLRTWLPVESSVLMPLPEWTGTGWSLVSLVALVDQEERGERFHVPWGVVQWDWPSGRLVALSNLHRRREVADALAAARAGAAGDDWLLPSEGRADDARKSAATRLEQLLEQPDADLSVLAGVYGRLLPPALYPVLWRLVDGSAAWLQRSGAGPPATAVSRAAGSSAAVEPEERLGPWLRQAEKLVDQVADPALSTRLAAIASRRSEPFRVAVLGTGPALAAAVDELLGRKVLPARAPRPLPVPVLFSTDPRLEVVDPVGPRTLALEPPSWMQLTDDDVVRVLIDGDVLRDLDGELLVVDTDRCASPVREACASSDVVLLVVSASSPLGMTERDMIENDCLGTHVPRVVVVVSQLHHIEPDERLPVVRYIANRAAKLGTGLEVLVADAEVADAEVEEAGFTTLSSEFPRLTARSGRASPRRVQVVGQLGDLVGDLVGVAARRVEEAVQMTADGAAARRAAELRIEESGLDWTGVRNELQHRANRNVDQLRVGLLNYRKDLTDRLEFALRQSGDPQKWWREEFEYHLRRDLEGIVRRYEHELTRRADADAQWLDRRADELFGRKVGTGAGSDLPIDLDDPAPRDVDAPDVSQYKVGFRIVPTVAAAVASLIGGPIGAAVVGAVAIVVGEVKLRGMVADQRELVVVLLRAAVDSALNRMSDELSDRVRRAYGSVLDDVGQAERAWRDAELAGLRPATTSDPRAIDLVDAARALHEDLRAAVARKGTAR